MTTLDKLSQINACSEARGWARKQSDQSLEALWVTCPRGDWLLWLADRLDAFPRPLLVEAACDCAETALQYCGEDELLAALWAIDSARRWAKGEADLDEVLAASYAAAVAERAAIRTEAHAQCAELVRARIPFAVIEAAWGAE